MDVSVFRIYTRCNLDKKTLAYVLLSILSFRIITTYEFCTFEFSLIFHILLKNATNMHINIDKICSISYNRARK
jgi:hypothetical protein